MINFDLLKKDLKNSSIESWSEFFVAATEKKLAEYTHGELKQWQTLIAQLPILSSEKIELINQVGIGSKAELEAQLNSGQISQFIEQLKQLHPWRKGPFDLYGIHIDTEWRSDWKWERIKNHIASLKNRTILDVGCGNGYHCWRMLGEEAKFVLGIDPSQKFLAQFSIIKKYLGQQPVHLLPLGIEDMPEAMGKNGFDTVFSMGVLYHRKSPINHLLELKNLIRPQGELVLETLIIEGDENQVLVPHDRYAQMRNVWFLPSTEALKRWMSRCGFKNIQVVDINQTSIKEQRTTDWMHFHSLKDYLDPNDNNLTIEGYPAPKRATLIATIN
ncbi:tRNA 5-methoxyuridine(34)/uridine 5-oxyacetic acid(34) synthase CmoB [Aliikangiella sp. IMCC44359]|uniref:tRNA 5-methoxyuridine(34)/uridine 5-oxyacetic acid(34) synthase CmoB n=1 Tax=Aliikangiella sp. IMCC44359 TaxID=3459125 RepID=UPI00403AC9A8